MTALTAAALLVPLMLALSLGSRTLRPAALWLAPAAAAPALLLTTQSAAPLELPWLLFGMRLGVDALSAPFLLLAGLLWTVAGCYSRGYLADDPDRGRFHFFFLLSLAGNIGLILALDRISFYLFFTLLTFSAYGLIVHDGGAEARRAGRVYLALAVLGELLLLTALLLLATGLDRPAWQPVDSSLAAHPYRDWIMTLALVGLGIKAGVAPLHVWLPLAHSYAPTPASAVLSGVIIKAGVLGWLRFLPLGEIAAPAYGRWVVGVGLFTAFYGVLCGLPQTRPKTVLAYSSVSQMGLITVLLGIALAAPRQWPFLAAALALLALYHGLAKGALFLGVGVAARGARWAGWLLILPALALAGAPLSSGYLAKLLLKDAIPLAPGFWSAWLPWLLALSSGATTLLMARFLALVWPAGSRRPVSVWLWLPWLGLLLAALALPWILLQRELPDGAAGALDPKLLLSSAGPVLLAGLVAAGVWLGGRRWGWRPPPLPEGDLLALATPLPRWAFAWRDSKAGRRIASGRRGDRDRSWAAATEQSLRQLGVSGLLLLTLIIGVVALLAFG